MTTKQPIELLGYAEIEAATGIPSNLLRQWAKRGKLPEPDFRVGQSPAWHKSTIEDWNTITRTK